MTQALDSLAEIASDFDAIILDQWGVLHDGTVPYPGVIAAVRSLQAGGVRLGVLSNSGKRSAPNVARIAEKGFAPDLWDVVMTSGEALWRDFASGSITGTRCFVLAAQPEDAARWAEGLSIALVPDIADAEAVIIMGLAEDERAPDPAVLEAWKAEVLARGLPVYCSNPDKTSPRAGGRLVTSPGAIAADWQAAGAQVTYYGKPHAPVFRALEAALDLPPDRLLMVGDSLEHDIAGGDGAGWSTAFIRGGIHAQDFIGAELLPALTKVAQRKSAPMPDYTLSTLR